jgi:hypothetical protein
MSTVLASGSAPEAPAAGSCATISGTTHEKALSANTTNIRIFLKIFQASCVRGYIAFYTHQQAIISSVDLNESHLLFQPEGIFNKEIFAAR